MNTQTKTQTSQLDDFNLEVTTVWSFPKRGSWATHSPKFRGNWAPQIPRNLILRYSKPKDLVLDQMCGGGTTLIECKILGRNAIGLDINPRMVDLTKHNLQFNAKVDAPNVDIQTEVGDARKLEGIKDNSIDLIVTHPPYADIIKYSDGKIEGDLSSLHSIDNFCNEMIKVASECFRVLKPKKYCSILIGDTRRKKYFIPIAYRVMQNFIDAGFMLKEDIIKRQWNCSSTPYWTSMSKKFNFFLIMHEHLFVFEKP